MWNSDLKLLYLQSIFSFLKRSSRKHRILFHNGNFCYMFIYSLLRIKLCRWRSLEGCSPWGRWGSGTTERLHFHFSLSCIGEGNGNPLQCSCLENPKDGGAWWAAVCGVAQSRTRLKRLSSSSSSRCTFKNISWTCSLSLLDLFCLTFFKLGKMSTFLSLNSLALFGVSVHTYK